MIGDRLASAELSDDSPWRPDADVEFEHPAPIAFGAAAPLDGRSWAERRLAVGVGDPLSAGSDTADRVEHSAPAATPSPRRSRRALALGVTLAAVAVAVVAVTRAEPTTLDGAVAPVDEPRRSVDTGGDRTLAPGDDPLVSAVAALDEPRLPRSVDELWSYDLTAVGATAPSVVAFVESIVVVSDTVDFDAATVTVLDAADGTPRWTVDLSVPAETIDVVGVVSGVVVLAAGRVDGTIDLLGFDEASGGELWSAPLAAGSVPFVERGADLLLVSVPDAPDSDEYVAVRDPATGDAALIVPGRYLGVDDGVWLLTRYLDGVSATAVDAGALSPPYEVIGAVVPTDAPFTMIGRELVVAAEPGLLTRWVPVVSSRIDRAVDRLEMLGAGPIDPPGSILALSAIGGSSLLIIGDGAVHGVNVGGESAEIRWRVEGVVVGEATTDRGRSLLVATEGGAAHRVLDASTGRTIAPVTMQPGALQTLRMVANGVVVREIVDGEPVRRGVDLNGRELWTLPGSGEVEVGHGVVVDLAADRSPDGSASWRLTAYGDADPDSAGFLMGAGAERDLSDGTWHRS